MPRLSREQELLINTLEELERLELRPAEPALTFRPLRWASGKAPEFDLAAIVDGLDDVEPAEESSDAGANDAATEAFPGAPTNDTGAEAPPDAPADRSGETQPPPLPGVTEIIDGVNRGELDPREIAEQSIARIAALDGQLNALLTVSADRARRDAETVAAVLEAGERPRPLAGVPLVHKDIVFTAGIRTTAGSELLARLVPDADAAVAGRLANAGTMLMGKSNTHEFATGATGTTGYFPPARNPWNPSHIPGGSSSGSAAALAAGLVPAATGTDTGGSIRIPAACCGVVGLKPTYGRVSRAGVIPFAWSLDHVGPMARSAADAAILLTAMAGHDPQDPASAEEPAVDFAAEIDRPVEGLRITVPDAGFLEHARGDVADAVRQAADVLEQLGAQRVEIDLPSETQQVGPAAVTIFLAEGGALHARTLAERPDQYQSETRAFLSLGDSVRGPTYVKAQQVRARLAAGFATVFQATDLLITPTLPVTAPAFDDPPEATRSPEGEADRRATLTLFTRPFNLTGLPAISVPCGYDTDGLPMGLQIVGRPFEEGTVLRAAHAFEQATEWQQRRPPGFGGD